MKAVVLARGLGTRMRRGLADAGLSQEQAAAADTGVKALIPLAGRPFLDYVLSALADAGITQACLVIGPEHAAIRERYEETAPPRRLRIAFAIQQQPKGTADAVLAAQGFTAGVDFLALNADNYYPLEALRALCRLGEPGTPLFSREGLVRHGNIPEQRIAAFALATAGSDGYLQSLIEKPDDDALARLGPDALVSMNCWRLSDAIYEPCRALAPSPRGELELPNAVVLAMERGIRFRVVRSDAGVLDLSSRADISELAARLHELRADP